MTSPQPVLRTTLPPPRLRFFFLGTTSHYFRVYATNVLLTLLTLGIYSAWAKVRNRRFFYGFTALKSQRFDFDARPLSILFARVIILIVLLLAALLDDVLDLLWHEYGLISTLLLLAVPFALVRARAFNARHSLYLGVRFHYQRLYLPSYRIFFLFTIPALAVLPLIGYLLSQQQDLPQIPLLQQTPFITNIIIVIIVYLVVLLPVWEWMRHKVRINQLSFGTLPMRFIAGPRLYYRAYTRTLLVPTVLAAALFISQLAPIWALYLQVLIAPLVLWLWVLWLNAQFVAIFWQSIDFADGGQLRANIHPLAYMLSISLCNTLIIIFSLGILLPWARVRQWRYIAARLTFLPSTTHSEVGDTPDSFKQAYGAEFGDIEGWDLDLAII